MDEPATHDNQLRHVSVTTSGSDAASAALRPLYEQKWALIVGIDTYQWYEERYHLKHAVADAVGVAELIVHEYGFPKDKVFLLCNQDATRDNIRHYLIDIIAEQSRKDDCVLIFFACHGEQREIAEGQNRYYLSTYDTRIEKTQSGAHKKVWSSFLSLIELLDAAEMIPAKHILFIVDACYSGFMTRLRGSGEDGQSYHAKLLTSRARQVITAGMDNEQVSDEGTTNNSIFTENLLRILSDNHDPLTASSLGVNLYESVSRMPSSRQTPRLGSLQGHQTGDFVFLRPSMDMARVKTWLVEKASSQFPGASSEKLQQILQMFFPRISAGHPSPDEMANKFEGICMAYFSQPSREGQQLFYQTNVEPGLLQPHVSSGKVIGAAPFGMQTKAKG